MAKKKKGSSRKSASSVRLKGRRTAHVGDRSVGRAMSRFVLPLAISGILLGCIVILVAFGYETATASNFFKLHRIDVSGNERTPAEDVRRIVAAAADKPGVWNADLSDIRAKLEKLTFVKAASVSRALPVGIRVSVTERTPIGIVRLKAGDFLFDGEAVVLAAAKEKEFPFVLHGWDETKSERAATDNVARVNVYKKMIDEWQQFDLVSRVKHVDLTNTREPLAIIEDSGRDISITLARDNFGKSLKTAIEAVRGKGARVRSVDAAGIYPVIQYLEF